MEGRSRTVVVLGGYGRVGRRLSGLLAGDGVRVLIAGPRIAQAEECAADISALHPSASVRGIRADATDLPSLRAALSDADAVVVTTPAAQSFPQIARASVEHGCDCIDITPNHRLPDREQLAAIARRHGQLVVVQAGLWPGLPSALARAVSRRIDGCRSVHVGMALSLKGCMRPEQAYALIDAAVDCEPLVWQSGKWRKTSAARTRVRMDYGPGFGERDGLPIDVPELHGIEQELGAAELAAFGATPAWRADVAARAIIRALYRVRRGLGRGIAARLLVAIANRPGLPQGVRIVATASGMRDGVVQRATVRLAHDDVAQATAIAVLAFIRQHLAKRHRTEPGLTMMGHLLDVEPALVEMQRLGLGVDWRVAAGPPELRVSVA